MENFKENISNTQYKELKFWQKKWFRSIFSATALGIILTIFFGVRDWIFQPTTFPTTIKVHGWKGIDHIPLKEGKIYLTLGDKEEYATINNDGEAKFQHIPRKYNNERVSIRLEKTDKKPYYLKEPVVCLKKEEQPNYVEVRLEGLDRFHGHIKDYDSDKGLQGVKISIAGIDAYTDETGNFSVEIPLEKQEIIQKVEIRKDNYEEWDDFFYNMEGGDAYITKIKKIK